LAYLDIGGSLRQVDLEGEILSEDLINIVVEGVVEDESSSISGEQVVASRDVVALAPIDLPLAEDWEPWLNPEADEVILTERLGA
jgi:hypothetical protein